MDIGNKIERLEEAIQFIKESWIGESKIWEGSALDLVGACKGEEVTLGDIRQLIDAKTRGEWTPLDLDGATIDGILTIRIRQ